MIKSILLVGIGGGIGSILRYLSSILIDKYFNTVFPLATFIINVLGCLLIGMFLGLAEKQHWLGHDFRLLFITGFCGGYTTFSTFANENTQLINTSHTLVAFAYIAASILTGLLFIWIGITLGKLF